MTPERVSRHAIEVDVHWNFHQDDSYCVPHLVLCNGESLFNSSTERLTRLGITQPEPPVVWRLLNVGEVTEDGDETWSYGGWVAELLDIGLLVSSNDNPVRRKLEGGAK